MKELLSRRLVLITGKGGVGRSTVTAAIAHVAQRAGKRVLVTEIGDGSDDYSALAQRFGQNQLPRKAAEIAPGILGSQLLADSGVELFLASVLRVPLLAKTALGFEPLRRLLTAAPSLKEMGVFFHLLTYLRAELSPGVPRYDLVLADMPATGHTLALTGLPEVILKLVTRGPIADGLREGQGWLHDPVRTGAWVVTLPERLPVSEALELLDGLEQARVHRGGVFLNRVPTDVFTPDEAEALERFIVQRPVFGEEGFHRIRESRRSVARLRSSTAVPTLQLPEIEQTGSALLDLLVQTLESEAFQPAAAAANGGTP